MDDREAGRQEAHRLLREMARVREHMRFFEPWDRPQTKRETEEFNKGYLELGRLAAAYSVINEYADLRKHRCPCCDLYTLDEEPPGTYDICPVCWWEDDPIQFADPDYRGGANTESLNEARGGFRLHGMTGPKLSDLSAPAVEGFRYADNYRERGWWRNESGPSMLLEIPDESLATVIGCLMLGILHAMRKQLVSKGTGEIMAWPIFRGFLEGKLPKQMYDVMGGMDEIDWGNYPGKDREGLIDDMTAQVEAALAELPYTLVEIGWIEEDKVDTTG